MAWSVTDLTGSFWLGLVAALVSGLVIGALIQLTVFRRAESMPHLNAVIVGVGLLIFIEAVLGMLYSIDQTRIIGTAFSDSKMRLGGIPLVSRQDLFVMGSVLPVMAALGYLMTRTPAGLRMRAAAFAPDTARRPGVKVSRMLTLGWALAGLAGALAAMLVIPTSAELIPQAMDGVFVRVSPLRSSVASTAWWARWSAGWPAVWCSRTPAVTPAPTFSTRQHWPS